jgi:PAS domain S-box-containing protein
MEWSVESKIGVGFCLVLVGLAAVRLGAYRNADHLAASERLVAHTHQVLVAVAATTSALQEADLQQRGYLIAGSEEYLEAYREARPAAEGDLTALRRLTADNPHQQSTLAELEPLVRENLNELDEIVRLWEAEGPDAARTVMAGRGEGKRNSVRTLLARMEAEERQLLHARASQAHTAAERWYALVLATTGLELLLAGTACWLIARHVGRHRRIESALRASEERFHLLVDGVKDYAVLLLSPEGKVVSWNTGARRIKGYTAGEIVGQPFSRFYTPEDVAHGKPRRELDAAARRGRFEEEGWRVRKDGTRFWADVVITPLKNSDGSVRGFAKVTRDITDRKRAEEELKRANAEAEEARQRAEAANRAKDRFLAVLSHELRTPLTPVVITAAMLEGDSTLPARVTEDARTIRRNVELEARLIDDLLDVTRIAKGKLQLQPEMVDAHALLRQTVDMCRSDLNNKRLSLALDLRAERRHVIADPARLQQVFWNLLKNAVKFTAEGGVGVRTFNDEGTNLWVEVRDSGVGIEPAVLPKVFDAFEQGDPSVTRTFGGLGLGLSICKVLVEMHGGQIAASSAGKGKGATFSVGLPTVPAPATNNGTPEPPRCSRSDQHPLRILLVEDHENTARAMARLLRHLHHDVTVAGSLAAARQAAALEADHGAFDLTISDLGLPDGSGLDLMKELKASYGLKGIALTGYGMEEDVQRSREAGFSEHLTKPVDPAKLQAVIGRIVPATANPDAVNKRSPAPVPGEAL